MRKRGNYIPTSTHQLRRATQAAWLIAIVIVSAAAGITSVWLAPGLDRYARDLLMRKRGPMQPPEDICIVAIDEPSIARLGRFPWSRDLTARAVDVIASGQPKVIALDVLYSEPTTNAKDAALADAIQRSRNTVVAAQLVEASDEKGESQVKWLRPLPSIEQSAAGVGHIHISTEADGAARELPLRKADDEGNELWSIAVEAVRVADGAKVFEVEDVPGAVRLGNRKLLLADEDNKREIFQRQNVNGKVINLRPDRMVIDYIGPTDSFASRTYSFADVLDGKIPVESFRGKYVLVGATAATLGDHVAAPFVHSEGTDGSQHGLLMPGVEVLANAVNTILRERYYRETPDWLALLCAALVAAIFVASQILAEGRFEALKQLGIVGGLITAILFISYYSFTHWLIIPPVVQSLVSLGIAAPLTLLRRSLTTSANLDERIAELSATETWLAPDAGKGLVSGKEFQSSPVGIIAELANADSVAIFARKHNNAVSYRLVAAYGKQSVPSLSKEDLLQATFDAENDSAFLMSITTDDKEAEPNHISRALTIRLGSLEHPFGVLRISYEATGEPKAEALRLCVEVAASFVKGIESEELEAETQRLRLESSFKLQLPKGVEWKARALGLLNRRMIARTHFVDRAFRSIEDGLIIADITGRILFANPRATEIFGLTERALIGSDLFRRVIQDKKDAVDDGARFLGRFARETLAQLLVERLPVEREIIIGDAPPRYYILRLSTVTDEEDGTVLGIVASLSDITRQRELQQTKNDVMALVTHELRTPLTAIQGMSEVLSQYEIEQSRRREMHSAINEEAKRLTRLINDYLDLARLESGARLLRLAPTRLATLIERALLMFDPLAQQQEIRIVRRFAPDLPPLLVDADLISQAVTNLVGNAIKYSNPASEIIVELHADNDWLWIDVTDYGRGIPAESLPCIFEKFYRVPHIEEADASGTGLGLAFVREIAEKHGGRVTVESEAGVGSVFSLRLPLKGTTG